MKLLSLPFYFHVPFPKTWSFWVTYARSFSGQNEYHKNYFKPFFFKEKLKLAEKVAEKSIFYNLKCGDYNFYVETLYKLGLKSSIILAQPSVVPVFPWGAVLPVPQCWWEHQGRNLRGHVWCLVFGSPSWACPRLPWLCVGMTLWPACQPCHVPLLVWQHDTWQEFCGWCAPRDWYCQRETWHNEWFIWVNTGIS